MWWWWKQFKIQAGRHMPGSAGSCGSVDTNSGAHAAYPTIRWSAKAWWAWRQVNSQKCNARPEIWLASLPLPTFAVIRRKFARDTLYRLLHLQWASFALLLLRHATSRPLMLSVLSGLAKKPPQEMQTMVSSLRLSARQCTKLAERGLSR